MILSVNTNIQISFEILQQFEKFFIHEVFLNFLASYDWDLANTVSL